MTALVIGANGYLGSHVTRQLVTDGQDVRVMVRPGAKTAGIDDLDVTRFTGDIWNDEVLRTAMTGCDVVFYCVVDTRGWLTDPAPLFRTNVEGTRNVLAVASEPAIAAGLERFVFTSSYVTVGRRRGHTATETDVIVDESGLTPYVRSRLQAENLVMQFVAERGLPAVAMCISTTYGAGDWGRTPHGAIIAAAAFGKLPFVMSGIQLEAVGIDDAARAMIAAARVGRVGERYLVSEKMISNADVVRIAAEAAGAAGRRRSRFRCRSPMRMAALGSAKAATDRHRPAAVAGLAAADARRGARRLLQGQARARLGAKTRRGVDPRGRPVLGESSRREAQEQAAGLAGSSAGAVGSDAEDRLRAAGVVEVRCPRPAPTIVGPHQLDGGDVRTLDRDRDAHVRIGVVHPDELDPGAGGERNLFSRDGFQT